MGSSHSKPSKRAPPNKLQKRSKVAKPTKAPKTPKTPKHKKPPVPVQVWSDKAIGKAAGLPQKPLKSYIQTPHYQPPKPLPPGARPKKTKPTYSNSSKAYAAQVKEYSSKPLPPLPPQPTKKTKPQLKVAVPPPPRAALPRPANYKPNLISPSHIPAYIHRNPSVPQSALLHHLLVSPKSPHSANPSPAVHTTPTRMSSSPPLTLASARVSMPLL